MHVAFNGCQVNVFFFFSFACLIDNCNKRQFNIAHAFNFFQLCQTDFINKILKDFFLYF